ncbi:MAG: hypothetical protein IAC06_08855 [Bacteroidetes bacterium]|jgi:hypothetical protein|uniref:Uncharacterized protein n=1 Tax=Candidatus Cryptobacteroides intestinavium TaxID=2840766 RepID=A0A9D9HG14_9BACT|nr:hypothetical protein [Candidatus Cryptobacteroides intestinavium]
METEDLNGYDAADCGCGQRRESAGQVVSGDRKEKIDLKKLVIYSEIMSPKFKE